MSKSHGLPFRPEMVRALLDGSKTMTRRKLGDKGPRFKAGDTIWVREGCFVGAAERWNPDSKHLLKADDSAYWRRVDYAADGAKEFSGCRKKYNSRYMPRWASRINLVVTATRVERLGDISESDAAAEGAGFLIGDHEYLDGNPDQYRACFRILWESIHGAGSWYENPEVEVISFEVQK